MNQFFPPKTLIWSHISIFIRGCLNFFKIFGRCAEIMRCEEIRWFDATTLYRSLHSEKPEQVCTRRYIVINLFSSPYLLLLLCTSRKHNLHSEKREQLFSRSYIVYCRFFFWLRRIQSEMEPVLPQSVQGRVAMIQRALTARVMIRNGPKLIANHVSR